MKQPETPEKPEKSGKSEPERTKQWYLERLQEAETTRRELRRLLFRAADALDHFRAAHELASKAIESDMRNPYEGTVLGALASADWQAVSRAMLSYLVRDSKKIDGWVKEAVELRAEITRLL